MFLSLNRRARFFGYRSRHSWNSAFGREGEKRLLCGVSYANIIESETFSSGEKKEDRELGLSFDADYNCTGVYCVSWERDSTVLSLPVLESSKQSCRSGPLILDPINLLVYMATAATQTRIREDLCVTAAFTGEKSGREKRLVKAEARETSD